MRARLTKDYTLADGQVIKKDEIIEGTVTRELGGMKFITMNQSVDIIIAEGYLEPVGAELQFDGADRAPEMQTAHFIGICGDMFAGKSTAKDHFFKRLNDAGIAAVNIPFAGPLKTMAEEFGWDGKKDEKGRRFLQQLGTEIGRAYNGTYWVEKWEQAVAENPSLVIIADDTRFPNEREAVYDHNGFMIKIKSDRKDMDDVLRMSVGGFFKWIKNLLKGKHASETGFSDDSVEHVISNDGTFGELQAKLDLIIDPIIKEILDDRSQ